ncbi:MAG: 16S rRNA (adenine(1518)-N(6)/adenine(1519)-N(6))-dimethyltransferase RsmA [Paludibacteraceae bacterium]
MTLVRAKKHLGQHFLTDLSVARRIADSLPADCALPILEVGPGMGVLSQFVIEKPNRFTAVEIDSESVEYLRKNMPSLDVVEGDFLKMNLDNLFDGGQFVVIGNFPYNISSQIFFRVLDRRDRIPCVVGMVQKEVAERIASPHGNKVYGITSVLLQAFYDIEYLFTVPEYVFDPPPKVKSAVIRLTRNNTERLACDEKLFVRVVKTAFNQRRKTLRNSLKPMLQGVACAEPIFDKRPEQLSVADFVALTNLMATKLDV